MNDTSTIYPRIQMRIIVFTSQLWNRTGGELNARDWAAELTRRGHRVTLYTPLPGPLAKEIHSLGIPVVDDPSAIADTPDVMFGSGINDAMALIARFPDVPLVQLSQQF